MLWFPCISRLSHCDVCSLSVPHIRHLNIIHIPTPLLQPNCISFTNSNKWSNCTVIALQHPCDIPVAPSMLSNKSQAKAVRPARCSENGWLLKTCHTKSLRQRARVLHYWIFSNAKSAAFPDNYRLSNEMLPVHNYQSRTSWGMLVG